MPFIQGAYYSESSLDQWTSKKPPIPVFNRSQRAAWHRIKTGLLVHRGERLRFISITTAPDMKTTLMKAWNQFILEIRRNWGKRQAFFLIRTGEGVSGVLHILHFGTYIPKLWLQLTWQYITGTARNVDIRASKSPVSWYRQGQNRLARYVIAQYAAGQSLYIRYSYSKDWAFDKITQRWKYWKKEINKLPLTIQSWESCILHGLIPGLPHELIRDGQVRLSTWIQ